MKAIKNLEKNMTNKVESKKENQTDSFVLKFSDFVFKPQINIGNSKQHMNPQYYDKELNLRRD